MTLAFDDGKWVVRDVSYDGSVDILDMETRNAAADALREAFDEAGRRP